MATEDTNSSNGVSFRGMPIVSSNPTAGTGVGATGIMVYKADKNSSPSQTVLTGQYTNTKSYNLFLVNRMFFDSDKYQSNTVAGTLFNNSTIDLSEGLPVGIPIDTDAKFDVTIYVVAQQILYEVYNNIYLGGQLMYIDQSFNPTNITGEIFLREKGIEDAARVGYGATFSYDTRSKQEKFYPRDSYWINLVVNDFPEAFGTDVHYYNATLNVRDYMKGFKDDDVLALQFYGQYSSENTPDGALSALGARSILRGFVIGQYKTRHMLAAQGEYRYQVSNTDFRVAAFAGFANLSGGSKGTAQGNRDADNGNYYSGGVGVRYTIQEEQGIDYRVDIATTNTHDYGIYANINQAF